MAPVTSSRIIRMNNTPTPVLLIILATLLLTCNILWLYTAPSHPPRNVCGYLVDSWTGARGAPITGLSGGGSPMNGSITRVAAPPPPAVQDYQLVRGSGLQEVPFPIPIPNDTVLLGEDLGMGDGFSPRYMTIGIASVWRKEQYLYRTLDSLLKETTEQDKSDIFIFLLLADADPVFRLKRARDLEVRYRDAVASGVLRVLQPTSLIYPTINFNSIWRTYNDSVSRVQWRTKQVLDFAFLFWYAFTRQPSKYYLILEDDVLSARHFVTAARDFVNLHSKRHWVALQLSGFMGIGQLIRCEDMDRLVSFLLLFYREHPVDILFNHWVTLMAPQRPPKDSPYRRVPGLFQHVGIHSTLANKTQPLRDNTFSLVKRRYAHVNPPADVVTTIRQYKSFVAGSAYSAAPGMFWGIPKAGDTYDVVFADPVVVARIVIITGATVTKKRIRDRLQFGQLQVSPKFEKMLTPNRAQCLDFVPVMEFRDGEVDVRDLATRFKFGIQCVRIVVGSKQRTWVSISEIAIFVKEGEATSKVTGRAVNIVGGGPSNKVKQEADLAKRIDGQPHNVSAAANREAISVMKGNRNEGSSPTTASTRQNASVVNADGKAVEVKLNNSSARKSKGVGNHFASVMKGREADIGEHEKSEGVRGGLTQDGTNSVGKDKTVLPGIGDEAKFETSGDADKIVIDMADVNGTMPVVAPYSSSQPTPVTLGFLENTKNGSVIPLNEMQDVFAFDVEFAPSVDGPEKNDNIEEPTHFVYKALSEISSHKNEQIFPPAVNKSATEIQTTNTQVVHSHNFSRINNQLTEHRNDKSRL